MNKYGKRMQIAISAAILIPELTGFLYTQFLLSSFPIREKLVLSIPLLLLALHWAITLIWGTIAGFERLEAFPLSLVFWITPAASMLSTMLLILQGRGIAPNFFIMGPMAAGFLFMVAGCYLPGKSLLRSRLRIGNLMIWYGGIIVVASGLVPYRFYFLLAVILAVLALPNILCNDNGEGVNPLDQEE